MEVSFWCLEIILRYFEHRMTAGQSKKVSSYCRSTPAPFACHLHGPNSRKTTEFDLGPNEQYSHSFGTTKMGSEQNEAE